MEAIPSVLAPNVRTTHRGAASNRYAPSYRGVSHGESPGAGKPVPESRSSRDIAQQHGNSRRSTDGSDLDRRIRRSGRAGLSASSSHHKSAISPRRTPHTRNGASAWRLHRPEFNHAFTTEQRSQRSTENPWKGDSCVDLAESIRRARTDSAPSVRATDDFSAKIPKNHPKALQPRHLRRPDGFRKNQKNSAKIPKFSSQWVFSKELMTRSMNPQKSEKGLKGYLRRSLREKPGMVQNGLSRVTIPSPCSTRSSRVLETTGRVDILVGVP
jgi:hypothetical protein